MDTRLAFTFYLTPPRRYSLPELIGGLYVLPMVTAGLYVHELFHAKQYVRQ